MFLYSVVYDTDSAPETGITCFFLSLQAACKLASVAASGVSFWVAGDKYEGRDFSIFA